jgi:site-specific DNA-methyltransferase (adenine-specific)
MIGYGLQNIKQPKREKKIHPTQKPVALYTWLLNNYAKKGDKILDTHVGSASSLIACHKLGFEYIGFEIDKDYYKSATARLKRSNRKLAYLMNPSLLKNGSKINLYDTKRLSK